MSYVKLLTHRCDIYHLHKETGTGDFGIPGADLDESFSYHDSPDHTGVRCYFTERNQSIVQSEPNPKVFQSFLIHFLPNVDVRANDKVIWNDTEFKLQIPRKIKNHHIEVVAVRSGNL
ncbi:DUF3599 domain-containing protein [Sporosarcina sp. P2]|uniref:DUF3599 family protein n=1 Tax=Sporosarcina sp. P2 TaxID=2048251 RepID=UPI000C16306A|nr:DUF3599 family protein [Sporosarcina sp. P2]PID03605.1 DUF3599 domain-containing protein [Sporosarcina sp. P2]